MITSEDIEGRPSPYVKQHADYFDGLIGTKLVYNNNVGIIIDKGEH